MVSKKISFLTAILLLVCAQGSQAMDLESIKKDGLQILINPSAEWFKFKAVVDGKVIRDLITPRPKDSTFKEKSLIFAKDTINVKEQQSFLFDKNGNELTPAQSIGIWKCVGKALVESSLANFPPIGTRFERSKWTFIFHQDAAQSIEAEGTHLILNTMQSGHPVVFNELDVIKPETQELFKKIYGLVYVAPDGQSFVIDVVFGDDK